MWKKLWNQLKPTDAGIGELTQEKIDALIARLEWDGIQTASKSDWRMNQDIQDAVETIKVLAGEREKLQNLVNRLNSAQVQTPERR